MVKGFINHDRQKSILYIFMDICLVSWIKYNYTKTSVLIKSIFFVGPQMTLGVYFLSVQDPQILPLKVVFAKNERGYRFTAINNRFWSLLILLLSVASIRRNDIHVFNSISAYTPFHFLRSLRLSLNELYTDLRRCGKCFFFLVHFMDVGFIFNHVNK